MHREDRSLQSLYAESSGCPETSSAGFCWRLPPSSEGERNPHARRGALVSVLCSSWVLCWMHLGCYFACIVDVILHVSWVLCCVHLGSYFACILGAVLATSRVLFRMRLGCCAHPGYLLFLGCCAHNGHWIIHSPVLPGEPWRCPRQWCRQLLTWQEICVLTNGQPGASSLDPWICTELALF